METRVSPESVVITAVVERIHPKGRHGPYFEARPKDLQILKRLGNITVSLDKAVWLEVDWPEEGLEVVLWDLRKKKAGWRAYKARFLRPEDEQEKEEARDADKE
jgi:hypothetical protein